MEFFALQKTQKPEKLTNSTSFPKDGNELFPFL